MVYTYIHYFLPNLGTYTFPMDPMGNMKLGCMSVKHDALVETRLSRKMSVKFQQKIYQKAEFLHI